VRLSRDRFDAWSSHCYRRRLDVLLGRKVTPVRTLGLPEANNTMLFRDGESAISLYDGQDRIVAIS
jgi:hypothetical protein